MTDRRSLSIHYAFAACACTVLLQAQRTRFELELDPDECLEQALKKEPPMLLALVRACVVTVRVNSLQSGELLTLLHRCDTTNET